MPTWEEAAKADRERTVIHCAGCERLRGDAADAAVLRRAFHIACEKAFEAGRVMMSKHPTKGEVAFLDVWEKLYEAVRDTMAGLRVLAEVANLTEEVRRLRQQNLILAERVANQSELLGRKAEKGVNGDC